MLNQHQHLQAHAEDTAWAQLLKMKLPRFCSCLFSKPTSTASPEQQRPQGTTAEGHPLPAAVAVGPAAAHSAGPAVAQSVSPAHAELENLYNSVWQVLEHNNQDEQYDKLKGLNVLEQCDKVLADLTKQEAPTATSKQAGKTADVLKSWDGAVTGADKFFAAVGKFDLFGKKWADLGAAGQGVATAFAGAAYVGPVFALVAFALKQWSMAAKLPAEAAELLCKCTDQLADIHEAWPGFASSPESRRVAEAAIKNIAKLINDAIVIRKESLICRFFMAQVQKDDLVKAGEKLMVMRLSLMTRLLLPPKVARQPLAAGRVFGFEEQAAGLAAELLLPWSQVLWLHGLGGSGKSTMACLLYNSLAFGVPSKDIPGFDGAHAFISLEGLKTQGQLRPLLLDSLKQLGATGIQDFWPAAELATKLQDFARQHRILLVLDNVWDDAQVALLLPSELHPDSRVIVTSREQPTAFATAQTLKHKRVSEQVYPLSEAAAEELFCYWLGKRTGDLPHELQDLQIEVIRACSMLPLALRVVGGYLQDTTDKDTWQAAKDTLLEGANMPNADTDNLLRGVVTKSFDRLTKEAQSMFLDSVSVLHGTSEEMALAIWVSWHGSVARPAWRELQRCALVTVNVKDDTLGQGRPAWRIIHVHDVVKALGRGIILNKEGRFYGSRMWVLHTGAAVQFKEKSKLQPLVAACLTGAANGPAACTALMQHGMAHLHILCADTLDLLGLNFSQVSPALLALTDLQVLQLRGNRLEGHLPVQLSALLNLQVLHLDHNRLSGRLPEQLSALTNLQRLGLGGNKLLGQLPKHWSALISLQWLNLAFNQLSGQLPEQWSGLNNLQSLGLANNQLSGPLPGEWSALTNLRQLWLFENQFSGQLPKQWAVLTALELLHVSSNQLSGQLPKQWSAYTNLKYLSLSHNKLSGQQLPSGSLLAVPEEWTALAKLEELNLCHNQLSGQLPEQWATLAQLVKLDMSHNQLSGQLPGHWSAFARLVGLDLSHNHLSGELPQQWSALPNLGQLNISSNELSGELPRHWSGFARLDRLDLAHNHLSGELPEQWSALHNLGQLNISSNQLSGELPERWSALPNLWELNISSNQLSGELPERWSALPNLWELNISSNQLSGELPEQWSAFAKLGRLDLSHNHLSGELPEQWSAFAKLGRLELSHNHLSGQLPEQWSALHNLGQLNISSNELSGQLPERWSALPNLWELNISSNQLSGELPEQWSAFAKLWRLDLSHNHLSGQLPEQWSALPNLWELNISSNQLSGELPERWSALPNLWELNISSNQLSGELPVQWSAFAKLGRLDLSHNHLSGQLPEQWSALHNLGELSISSNELLGQLPQQWSALTNLRYLWLHHNQLSGHLPEQWSTLTNLELLHLHENQISRQLPEEWPAHIQLPWLSGHQLSGASPEQWQDYASLVAEQLHLDEEEDVWEEEEGEDEPTV